MNFSIAMADRVIALQSGQLLEVKIPDVAVAV
jgi:hypothetical protein